MRDPNLENRRKPETQNLKLETGRRRAPARSDSATDGVGPPPAYFGATAAPAVGDGTA